MLRISLLFLTALALCACGGAGSAAPRPAAPKPPVKPAVVTSSTYDDVLRDYYSLDLNDPERRGLRDKIIGYLFGRCGEILADNDYQKGVELLHEVTSLYTVQEMGRGEIPQQLEPLAQFLIERGSPRGDEARVLSALLALKLLHPDRADYARDYDRLKSWTREARETLSDPIERYQGLIDVWQEHIRLTPTPELLDSLANLLVERYQALVDYLRKSGSSLGLGLRIFQSVQTTSLEVASIYLRYGDVASALTHIQALRVTGSVDERLVEALNEAREGDENGTGAILDLAGAFLKAGRSEISLALCREGLRQNRTDSRFPQCLARVAATESHYADAMAWYAEAIRMAPEEQRLYDETLEVLNHLLERELFETDPSNTRQLANRAQAVLQERMRRWPSSPPAVSPFRLYLAIGISEMNAGNTGEAEDRLRASLKEQESLEAFLQLGILLERTGRAEEAARTFRQALGLTPNKAAGDSVKRAEILEMLGDSLRISGGADQGTQSYQEALKLWESVMPALEGTEVGDAQVRRGVLWGRLGQKQKAIESFKLAMRYAPGSRETYATILSYLVVGGFDEDFGFQVFYRALRQMTLEPQWKVYFALWVRIIAARTGTNTGSYLSDILEEMSEGNQWSAKLARFGARKIGFSELVADASNLGERTEAYFYEAGRRMGEGDADGARQMLKQVLDTRMVSFYEYAMAQELLGAAPLLANQPAPKN